MQEFFRLFKTPWEFFVPHHSYDLLIATTDDIPDDLNARVLVVYQSHALHFDERIGVVTESQSRCDWAEWRNVEFPVYGDLALFRPAGEALVQRRQTLETVARVVTGPKRTTVRIGLDLFYEVAFLLSQGQPSENAGIATLDIHISLLRTIMVEQGVPFVEVPPAPAGFDFMACLTHDVDFVGVRDHKFDHTMWGFLYRCTFGSLLRAIGGRLPWSRCFRNWSAALSLPLVYLGVRDDFWLEFGRYCEIERKLGSTFFFIPYKNVAGLLGSGSAPKRRAAKYDVTELKAQIADLLENGCEVGLHGLDAWQSSDRGVAELRRIQELTGHSDTGTRMHWLYWNDASPETLEEAGFSYDSTFGYNDAIGFRAGTSQPFCPLNAERMLELPLNIQDSAMFYSDRMRLSETEALDACKEVIHSAASSGGALTVNWHTRSLSPERLWGDFYRQLLCELKTYRVRFGTAQNIVAWFRKRHALHFDFIQSDDDQQLRLTLSSPAGRSDPPFTVRTYHPRVRWDQSEDLQARLPVYTDRSWNGEEVLELQGREVCG